MAKQQLAGNKFQQYQQATSQLLNIQQQQKANVAQAITEEALTLEKNKQLLQSSEFMAQQVAANNVLSQQVEMASAQGVGSFNPATVGTLSQYGLGQPKQVKSTTSNSSSQQQTKQKVTINNKTENIVYNDVKVPASVGVQNAPIQVTNKSKLDGGLGKFKSWLGNTFNQQSEASARRQREFRRKDADLTKQSNKLIRDLDKSSKSLGDRLDPKHVYRDVGSAFKNVLLLFGLSKLAHSWPQLMNSINNIESAVSDFFENRKERTKNFFSKNGTFSVNITKMFGGKPGESPGKAFRNLLFDEKEGLFAYISKYFKDRLEERAAAIKTVKKPDFSLFNISQSLGSLGTYLADILAAILNPQGAGRRSTLSLESQAREDAYDEKKLRGRNRKLLLGYDKDGNKVKERVYDNDLTLVRGDYKGLTKDAVDKTGNLTNKVSSYYSQSTFLKDNLKQAEEGKINTANVGVGFERLYRAAQNHPKGKIPVSVDFIKSILSQKEIDDLGLKTVQYTYVIRKRSEEDILEDLKRKNANTKITSSVLRGFLGGPIGAIKDLAEDTGTADPSGMGKIIKELGQNNVPIYQYELVSPDEVKKNDIIANYGELITEKKEKPLVYEVSPEIITKLVEKLTGKPEINVDINDKEFMSAIESGLTKLNKSDEINKQMNIENTYAANNLYEKNRAAEKDMFRNSRMASAGEGVSEVAEDIGDYVKEKANEVGDKLRKTKVGKSLFSDRESATYKREGKSDVSWSDIRINKSDKQYAHEGTGPVGKDKINRDYLTDILEREIGGEWGRKEGNANDVYVNKNSGGKQKGHAGFGYGNAYSTLVNLYNGVVKFKMPDGTIKEFKNLTLADKWFVDYWKKNIVTTKKGYDYLPDNKKVYLTDETAKAINKASLKSFIDTAEKMDPEILGAMDEQTLGGLLHIAYGGPDRYLKLISFYNSHKKEALEDLQSNNGVHTEDFINRVMMNTREGETAMHTAWDGHHTDRRGVLTGYHTFNFYSTDNEWEKHLALENSKKSDNKSPETQKNNDSNSLADESTKQTSTNSDINFEASNILPEINIVSSPIENSEKSIEESSIEYNNILNNVGGDKIGDSEEKISELSFENTPEEKIDAFDYELSSPTINTQQIQAKEINTDDKNSYIVPVAKFTEKLVNIDNLLSLMVSTSNSNLEATMNVLDALASRKAAESKSTVREVPSFSYTANASNNISNNDYDYSNIFYNYGGNTNLNNTQG